MARRALVLLAPGAEEMEVVVTVDVLRRAEVDVVLARIPGAPETVECSRGTRLVADASLVEVSGPWDAVVLPGGGPGSEALAASEAVGDVLRVQEEAGGIVAAICAAPVALAAHGVGSGRAMTSHPGVRDRVAAYCGAERYREDAVVEDGALVTSRGPGTAFAFALALVGRLCGDNVAAAVRAPMMLDA